jgi:molybdopterin synthase catalytic subunit
MNVSVRLFAGLQDLIGEKSVSMELPDGATVADMRERLGKTYPHVTPFLTTLVCAVDDEYVPTEHRLRDGDDVSLIPPVSGGSDELIAVTAEPLDGEALVRAVRRDESGAVVLFHGVARNHSEGRRVRALEYEAHESLAVKKLHEVAGEARARFPITDIGILHRTGHLEIGEASLLVAVSAAHRKEAFDAAQYAVDRIKQTVPIWKKEIWEDGGGAWVPGHQVEVPEPARTPGS